jgi:hypothetical protein
MGVIDCNLLIDDDFMNKDVSELVQGDFYLFSVKDNKTYLFNWLKHTNWLKRIKHITHKQD